MDCSCEENLIKMKLEDVSEIVKLDFDLAGRRLTVYTETESETVLPLLESTKLDAILESSEITSEEISADESSNIQSKLLWIVLGINFLFFIIESVTGFISHSMGLVADSLDMLADSIVYGLSLWAVGTSAVRKKKVASLSGYIQMALAFIGLVEVIRRFFIVDEVPDYRFMMIVAFTALIANAISLIVLQRSKSKEAHMEASMIFTSNDVIINAGVIGAGALVLVTNSKYPDLIIGMIVFYIVFQGARRILSLGK